MTEIGAPDHRRSRLVEYRILDTPPEQGFDDIVTIAAQSCATPVALVSLVDTDRQWFKARVGFDPHETPIAQSVCAHQLDRPGILEVRDMASDPLTSANPLVTGPPFARFYAGAPLIAADGTAVGRLCVIDVKARPGGLDDGQARSLEALARLVMAQLELRATAYASDADAAVHKAIGDAAARREALAARENEVLRTDDARARAARQAGRIGTFEVDVPTGQVIVTAEFCEIFGLPVASTYHVDALEALIVDGDRVLVSSIATRGDGSAEADIEYRIRRFDDGEQRWIARRASFTRDTDGAVALMHGTVHDVTERHDLAERQDVLNHEISHRLKNTLAMVQAIAVQTLRKVVDREPVDLFERRLMALSTAHDTLLLGNWRSAEIGATAAAVLGQAGQVERVTIEGPPIALGPRPALSFALLLHELATNAVKYGALSVSDGRATLDWSVVDGELVIRWRETGGPPVAPPSRRGFGTRLIQAGLIGTGGVDLRYDPDGVTAELRAPLGQLGQS